MHPAFPSTTDRIPWPGALLAVVPFFIAGPLRIVLSYQPGWMPRQQSLPYFFFLLLCSLAVGAGFGLGVAKKFPRWAYPYPVYLAISLNLLLGYAVTLFHWNLYGHISFFLILGDILILLCLPGFRSFYRRIPQDWTLLSYGLYGLVLYLLASLDFDETPRLTVWVLLPSLLALCAALAHLRIRSAYLRIAALLAGTFAGLFFWLMPIFQGMVSIWIGVGMGLFLLLAYGAILGAILLAPLLVTGAIHSWRASRAAR